MMIYALVGTHRLDQTQHSCNMIVKSDINTAIVVFCIYLTIVYNTNKKSWDELDY